MSFLVDELVEIVGGLHHAPQQRHQGHVVVLHMQTNVLVFLFLNRGIFWIFFMCVPVLYSTLLYLPSVRFHCVGGCWDRTQDCCDFGIGC
jgi:hypothetical protein